MFIAIIMSILSFDAHAINPFAVLGATQKIAGVFGSDGTSDAMDAMTDLFSEVNTDDEAISEGNQVKEEITKLESVYREMEEMGYSSSDVISNLKNGRNFAETIRGVTNAIRTVKRLVNSVKALDKRAQTASVESANYEREQLLLQYEQYNLQKVQELREMRHELESIVEKKRLSREMEANLRKSGARPLGAKGLLIFPRTEDVIEDGLKVAKTIRPYLLALVIIVLLMRVIFYQFSFEGQAKYGDLIRDVFVCCLLLFCYPDVIRASHSLSQSISDSIAINYDHVTFSGIWTNADVATNDKFKLSLWLTGEVIWQGIRWIGYTIAQFCFKYLILIMVVLTPIVIFISEMFNFTIGWKVFFLGFVCLNLWPILWNLFGRLLDQVSGKGFSAMTVLETCIAMILQVCSPFLLYSLTKLGAGGGLKVAETVGLPFRDVSVNAAQTAAAATSSGVSTIAEQFSRGEDHEGYKIGPKEYSERHS